MVLFNGTKDSPLWLLKGVAMMVGITEIAAQKVKEVMVSQNKENSFLRLYVAGFG